MIFIAYCTNVHAGADLESTQANLRRHALAVKERVSPDRPLGVGLWLSAAAAQRLRAEQGVAAFAEWLAEAGLLPFTLNGFPFGDFHKPVVKHEVYHPTWREPARLDYTLDLIEILDGLLPAGLAGSISTLPLEWGQPAPSAADLEASSANLRRVAERLRRLEQDRGRLICLCLEPEPGCVLQRCDDVIRFFEEHLLRTGDEAVVRRHVQVCHDVCHTAVMFEDQADVLRRYRAAGIGVGKVQVSSALALPLDELAPGERAAAVAQLRAFTEDRYLHQTVVRRRDAGDAREEGLPQAPGPRSAPKGPFFDDLPQALAWADAESEPAGEWRVHFHVPIYLEQFGRLRTTQAALRECLAAASAYPEIEQFEVETYAWGVLPKPLQRECLADGIADELKWFNGAMPR